MIPLTNIKVKSASMKKSKKGFLISAADPDQSYFKRDVPSIIKELNQKLDKEKSVTEHFYSVLSQSEVGRNSSLGQHLCYKFKLNQMGDHQYISKQVFEKNILGIEEGKANKINETVNKMNQVNSKKITQALKIL